MPPNGFRWMTAEEWDTSDYLWLMVHNAEQQTGDQRKMSLFGAGSCRMYWTALLPESQAILAEFEVLLDTLLRPTDHTILIAGKALCSRANLAVGLVGSPGQSPDRLRLAAAKAVCYAVIGSYYAPYSYFSELEPSANGAFVHLLRDIFGNPFRPAPIPATCRTTTVTSLALHMYESGDYSPMPILGDALEESGCMNPEVLDHCRNSAPHFRGCWVVDALLGRS